MIQLENVPFEFDVFNRELADWFLQQQVFGFDIETDTDDYNWHSGDRGLSYVTDPTFMSFYSENLGMVVSADPIFSADDANKIIGYEFGQEETEFIIAMFSREHYIAIAHNLIFDARQIFGKFNIGIPDSSILWDTLVINILGAWGIPEQNSLEALEAFFEILQPELRSWWSGMKKHRKYIHRIINDNQYQERNKVTENDAWLYCILDSYVAYKLWELQMKLPRYDNGASFSSFDELLRYDLEYTKFCVEVAAKGIRLNQEYVLQQRDLHIEEYQKYLEILGGQPEDWRKPAVLKNYITQFLPEGRPTEEEVTFHPFLRTKTGALSFSAEAIEYWTNNENKIEELKPLGKLKEHEAVLKRIDEWLRHAEFDGRIHSMLSRNTITGRNSSSQPNIQNINFKEFAGYLTSDNEDYILCEFDYSNAENRIAAMYAKDNAFALACIQTDFHSAMAEKYFGDAWYNALSDPNPKLKKDLRNGSKKITFGTAYGMGAYKLAWSLQVPMQEAETMLRNKDLAFPAVANAKAKSSVFAEKFGYTILWSGRRVQILKKDGKYKGYTAWNSLAQGGVSELVVRAIVDIRRVLRERGFKSQILGQVHDSIILHLHVDEYEEVVPIVIEIMATAMPDVWNNRTAPATRWLTDLDHSTNSKKWGYRPGVEYPFNLNEYVNRWGFHQRKENENEAPVWINQWGYDEQAVAKEMGFISTEPINDQVIIEDNDDETGLEIAVPSFDWLTFQKAIESTCIHIRSYQYQDRTFGFPESMELLRALCHKGIDTQYLTIVNSFDTLIEVINSYEEWRKTVKGC